VLPFLSGAVRASPSALVFPADNGEMRSREFAVEAILRRAMARAGIVTGYTHVCRARGCAHRANDNGLRRCPIHQAKLWPKAKVRQLRFHDLRDTRASLVMQAGANPAAVQRIFRHQDVRITTDVYGHLAPEYLRAEVDRLTFDVAGLVPVIEEPSRMARIRSDWVHMGSKRRLRTQRRNNSSRIHQQPQPLQQRSRRDSNARPLASEASTLSS